MNIVAFCEGRPMPQPRSTQRTKFLFGTSVEKWEEIDKSNAKKAELGMVNRLGRPYKATRYAYKLRRLLAINEYRNRVRNAVYSACGGVVPHQNLFFLYLFHTPKSWSKKKALAHEWTFHNLKPDYSNLLKGVEDALYENDSSCNAVANYKIYVPRNMKEGVLIMQDDEIHKYIIDTVLDGFYKKMDYFKVQTISPD